jgi:hypothetical protein
VDGGLAVCARSDNRTDEQKIQDGNDDCWWFAQSVSGGARSSAAELSPKEKTRREGKSDRAF